MNILISNDDGYRAVGIKTLAEKLKQIATVCVVAPDRNKSGASSSLTLDMPMRVSKISENLYATSGSPADCVHLGCYRLMQDKPDMVVSGINHGANLGDDVLYSGTVAAALEGRHLGMSAIAVSLVVNKNKQFTTAAEIVVRVIKHLETNPLATNKILNINVPDLPIEEIKGIRITRLGSRHRKDSIVDAKDPKGRRVYWLGPPSDGEDVGAGTDFHAISEGFVSITPISVDFTDFSAMDELNTWVEKI